MKQLPIPDSMKGTPDATELIRAFMENDELHMSLNVGLWEDPLAWGIVLADVVRHVSEAYQKTAGLDQLVTAQQIAGVLLSELRLPSSETQGHFIDDEDTKEDM